MLMPTRWRSLRIQYEEFAQDAVRPAESILQRILAAACSSGARHVVFLDEFAGRSYTAIFRRIHRCAMVAASSFSP